MSELLDKLEAEMWKHIEKAHKDFDESLASPTYENKRKAMASRSLADAAQNKFNDLWHKENDICLLPIKERPAVCRTCNTKRCDMNCIGTVQQYLSK